MPKITLVNEKRDIEVSPDSNLREELRKAGVQVYSGPNKYLNCFGHGSCGTCKVLVKKGQENLSPKGILEKLRLSVMMSAIGLENEVRLCCQCTVQGDCTVETSPGLNLSGDNFWQKPYPNK